MKFSNTMKSSLAVVACMALGLAVKPAAAATATTTFQVSATIQATCSVSATAMAFGNYVSTTASTATSTVSVTCTNTTPYSVGLNAGATSGATTTTRQMAGPGGASLNYGLYTDSSHSTNWDDIGGSHVQAGTGSGSAQSLTVYGQIPSGQYLTPGSYSDTITATVSY